MSARIVLQAAVVARLGSVAGLRVFDAPPVRGGVPYAVVDEPVLQQADAVALGACVGTLSVACFDAGERPVRLRQLSGGIEDAIAAMPPALGEGWRLVGVKLMRSRVVRVGDDRWRGVSDFAVRIYRES